MRLSYRLRKVSELVDDNSSVIDIGCDHALLDIYLTTNKNCKCIATDINDGALVYARRNIEAYHMNDKIILKKADGLNGINVEYNDTIIITGMGTRNIISILKNQKLSNTLILSSANELDQLRLFVTNLGYYIKDELFITDKNKKYVIIKFVKGHKKYSTKDIKLGPVIRHNNEYINYVLNKYNTISRELPKSKIIKRVKTYFIIKIIKRELH